MAAVSNSIFSQVTCYLQQWCSTKMKGLE